MARKRTPEEIRKLKERGLIDVGTTYLPLTGAERVLRRPRNWTEEDD